MLYEVITQDGITHMIGAFLQEFLDIRFKLGKVKVKMFGLAQFECAVTCLCSRVLQFLGFKHISAVIALVRTRTFSYNFV